MKTWMKYISALMIAGMLGTLFYFKVYIPKTTYKTLSAKKGDLLPQVQGIGEVNAKEIYTLSSQINGKIIKLTTDEGKWVKKGELIAVLDPVELPSLLAEAKASYKKAEFELDALHNELVSLKAQKHLSSITYERYKKLYEQKFAAQVEFDKASAELVQVNAQIAVNLSQTAASRQQLLGLEKNIEALKAKLDALNIYAPVSGYVISKDAELSQTVLPGQSIVKIVDTKSVWVKAYIDERISANIKIGAKAQIILRSQSNKLFDGTVVRIYAISDAATQEREVAVAFEKLPIPFYLYEQAEVKISTGKIANTYILPASALIQRDGIQGVWINKDLKAYFQAVDITAISDDRAAIAKGIDENTQIILPDSNKKELKNGMRIHL